MTQAKEHRQRIATDIGTVCMSDAEVLEYMRRLEEESPAEKAKRLRRLKQLYAVLFDMDGVIFDSERWVMASWQDVAARHDIPEVEETVRHCFGTNNDGQRAVFKRFYGEDFPYDAYKAEVEDCFMARYKREGHLPLKPGVVEILSYLRGQNIAVALATSTRRSLVTRELADAGIADYFDEVVCGDMVAHSKPAPDIFVAAAKAVACMPQACAVVEDSYNGVRAANAAGCRPIMVPDMIAPDDEMFMRAEIVLPDLFDALQYFKDLLQ